MSARRELRGTSSFVHFYVFLGVVFTGDVVVRYRRWRNLWFVWPPHKVYSEAGTQLVRVGMIIARILFLEMNDRKQKSALAPWVIYKLLVIGNA
jgi:hypothetical protein